MEHDLPLTLGPFRVTPTLVDHSAYDAYALLVEAGRRRLFYSGDLRAQGRKGVLFERLLRDLPRGVDTMLMEGSTLGRLAPDGRFPTEGEIEATFVERLRAPGFVAVCASAQNIDRVVSLYRACKKTGRTLVLCRIHRKYVRGAQASDGYDLFDGLQVTGSNTPMVIATYDGPGTLRRWVEAARSYAGEEKQGVAVIAARHPEVIDVEMALPANEPTGGEAKVANRMDIVALEEEHEGARLAFYEAKLFTNPELRADDLKPRVMGQLQRYRDYVTAPDRRSEVIAAYGNARKVLAEIAVMRGSEPAPLVRAVADGAPLALDPAPRLVVFGHQAAQVAPGSSWQSHADALRDGGIALVLAAEPHDIVLRRPERAIANTPGGH
ncbi:hypothetical protein GOFOIKOB_1449 [Methylobacterium tardum]|uniref:Uncharacterized protein n=1 Tax=Methylobacterium tardum TaxID=374432 RepID=A0AA37WTV3_9HYPH|nr:hypothetical protein GOFOIKOB_1449 [Methylobacterium tardum]GLS73031.1 hypothetical protein GCM10007890_50460 [Methylobacterium tardum]